MNNNNDSPENSGSNLDGVGVASQKTRRSPCKHGHRHGHKHRHHRRLQANRPIMATATAFSPAGAAVVAPALVQNSPPQLFRRQSEASSSQATALTDPYQLQHAKMLAEEAILANLPSDHPPLPKEKAMHQKGRRCYFAMFMDSPDPVIPGKTVLEATNLGLQEIGKPFRLQRSSPSPPQSFTQPGPSQVFAQISPLLQAAGPAMVAGPAMAASFPWPEPSYPEPSYAAAHPSLQSSSSLAMEVNPSGRPEPEYFPTLGDEWDLINFDGDTEARNPDEQNPVNVAVAAQASEEALVDQDSQMALVDQFVRHGENDQNFNNDNDLNDHHFDDTFFGDQNLGDQEAEDQDFEYAFGIAMGGSMGH